MTALDRLAALDPTTWGLPLSPAMARVTWEDAVEAIAEADLTEEIPGIAPRSVAIVASANVYTAPLSWMAHLTARGVHVVVKPARGQEAAVRAMAACFPGVEVRVWTGGDVEAEALHDVSAVLAFGTRATIDALRTRVRVPFLGFGPRFGVSVVEAPGPEVVEDVALYDGRGCMSPAAVFADRWDVSMLAHWMADAEERWPRGDITAAEAAEIRAKCALAAVVGEVATGERWAVVALPGRHFSPVSLPRVLVVHPRADLRVADLPELGTIATDFDLSLHAPRLCYPGEMQRPLASRWHDGIDVLGTLWAR